MDDTVQIEWNGEDLSQALRAFRTDVSEKIVRDAVRDAANQAAAQLREAAPRRTGRLARAIAVRTGFSLSRGLIKADVVIYTRGKTGDPNDAFYWRFVEYGHRKRPNAQKVSRGTVPGVFFIRNVWLRLEAMIANRFFAALDRGVNKTYTRAQP